MLLGQGGRVMFSDLSGGAGVPGTPSSAAGIGFAALNSDNSQALVWLTLTG